MALSLKVLPSQASQGDGMDLTSALPSQDDIMGSTSALVLSQDDRMELTSVLLSQDDKIEKGSQSGKVINESYYN